MLDELRGDEATGAKFFEPTGAGNVTAGPWSSSPGAPEGGVHGGEDEPVDSEDPVETELRSRLVGDSEPMRRLRSRIRRAAGSLAPVLVHGESGTGKELVARLVHDLSPRAAGPFVALDCGALAEGLLESELFGHARGAFTGAAGERRGLFEAAAGGTLFLDEIANTSLAFQARLLRVLQEREVRRVGAETVRRIDVRVVAASNRDLRGQVAEGHFREDLLYRLRVIPLEIAPLRSRRSDVPALARHLLAALSARDGVRYELSRGALLALVAHAWPGNVRELANALERAAAFCDQRRLVAADLPEEIVGRAARSLGGSPLSAMLADVEGALVAERLDANGWNRTETARELGITRRCLFDKIQRHGLRRRA